MHSTSLPQILMVLALVIILAATPAGAPVTSQCDDWLEVRNEKIDPALLGISGMAWLNEGVSLVVVHDNKLTNQPRIGILTLKQNECPPYTPIDWPVPLPVDLEAIAAIPGRDKPRTFLAITSRGDAYVIEISEDQKTSKPAIRIVPINAVPDGPQYIQREGLALQRVGDTVIAVWADRGCRAPCNESDPPRSATLIWNRFDPDHYKFLDDGPVKDRSQSITVDFPKPPCVRPISDIKISEKGSVFISAARECENVGTKVTTYESAVYEIGNFRLGESGVIFQKHKAFTQVSQQIQKYKIEALEFMPGPKDRFIFGTDDELEGGRIFIQWR